MNGFELPEAFVQLCEAIRRGEAPDEWELKEDVDAYGQPWQVADLRIEYDPKEMQYWTERISEDFLHKNRFQQLPPGDYADAPGLIQDFTGVANFVRFAHATDGAFYCFDFGTDPKVPSVVYWQDGYWRRAAPNFAAFMALFVPEGEGPDRSEEEPPPPPRFMLKDFALKYLLILQRRVRGTKYLAPPSLP